MKIKLFVLIVMGITLIGCAVSSSGISSQTSPSSNGLTPGNNIINAIHESGPNASRPQQNPDGSVTFFTIGKVQFKFGPMTRSSGGTRSAQRGSTAELDEQIKQHEAYLATNLRDYDTCIMLAGLYIESGNDPGDADMAIKYCTQALAINNSDTDVLFARALAYSKKEDPSSRAMGLKDLEVVLKSNRQRMTGAYYVMGVIYYKDQQIDKAIEAFENVKAIDPEYIDTAEILEVLYRNKK